MVARYWIYLFRDDVAYSYYDQAEKIVQLLREYQYQPTLKSICRKQIEFITERLSFSRLELGLKEHFVGTVEKNLERNMFVLREKNEEALIIVQKRRLLLVCDYPSLTERIFQTFSYISPFFFRGRSIFSSSSMAFTVGGRKKICVNKRFLRGNIV